VFFGGDLEYPHGQKQDHNSFTTKTTVGICRICTLWQNISLAKTRTFRGPQCHAHHRRPNSDDGAKDDNDNGPAGGVGCGDHFVGGVGALMGSGAMMTMTTKINDGARPPKVVVTV
jgi:hypothetical protein